MSDIDELFERAKKVPVPELAPKVSSRIDGPGTRVGTDEPGHPPVRQRVIAVLVSFAIVGAAGTLLWRTTRGTTEVASSSSPSVSDVSPGVSDVLRVTCDADSIEVLTPVVAAQADGLHVLATVTELSHPEIRLRSSADSSVEYWSGSSGVDGEFVRGLAVGDATVHCESGPHQSDGPEDLTAPFTLVDPEGVFIPYQLACAKDEMFVPLEGQDEWPPSFPPSLSLDRPEEVVRAQVSGIQDDDVVERAGYTGVMDEQPIVRLVRNGEVIGKFWLSESGAFGAHVAIAQVCPDSGLGPA